MKLMWRTISSILLETVICAFGGRMTVFSIFRADFSTFLYFVKKSSMLYV